MSATNLVLASPGFPKPALKDEGEVSCSCSTLSTAITLFSFLAAQCCLLGDKLAQTAVSSCFRAKALLLVHENTVEVTCSPMCPPSDMLHMQVCN